MVGKDSVGGKPNGSTADIWPNAGVHAGFAPAGLEMWKCTRPALFVGSGIYRQPAFGKLHPLSGPRIALVTELSRLLGWLPEERFCHSPAASLDVLHKYHDEKYVAALQQASDSGQASLEVRERYRIGTMENPLFPGLFQRAASTVGGSIMAAELAMTGAVAYHPAGGTHHGRRDRASGFCYFNDPVFALDTFLDQGLQRVLYVDLDAHHGDGVQDFFAADPRVLTVSIHEAGRWPFSGAADDRGLGRAYNFPVPAGFNDAELDYVMQNLVLPLTQHFEPQALVVVCGADGLAGDPLSRMRLSNVGLWRAVLELSRHSPRVVVLGGGGYNPWTLARFWTGLWGLLSGQPWPEELPPAAQELLQGLECDLVDDEDLDPAWLSSLADEPKETAVRPELVSLVNYHAWPCQPAALQPALTK
jgi:acetoin utilization protein AcuC